MSALGIAGAGIAFGRNSFVIHFAMLALKEFQEVAGVVLHYGKTVCMQIEIARRQFSFKFYFTFPLDSPLFFGRCAPASFVLQAAGWVLRQEQLESGGFVAL